jgi:hypothetical protein
MSAVVISFYGQTYGAEAVSKLLNETDSSVPVIQVFAKSRFKSHDRMTTDEEEARRWLCDHGLRKGKARKLLAAALRGEGELADPDHPNRIR